MVLDLKEEDSASTVRFAAKGWEYGACVSPMRVNAQGPGQGEMLSGRERNTDNIGVQQRADDDDLVCILS